MLDSREFTVLKEGGNGKVCFGGEHVKGIPFIAVYHDRQEPYLGFGFQMPEAGNIVFRGNGDGAEITRVWRAMELAAFFNFADPEMLETCLMAVSRRRHPQVTKSRQLLINRFGQLVFEEVFHEAVMTAIIPAKELDSMITRARKAGIILDPTDLEMELLLGRIEETQAVKFALREAQLTEFRKAEDEEEIARPMAPADSLDKFLSDISKRFGLKIGETQHDVLIKGAFFNSQGEKRIPIMAENEVARQKDKKMSLTITRIGPPQIQINGITWAFGAARYEKGQIYVTTLIVKNGESQPIMAEYPVRALRHLVLGENPWQ